jgi:hypothetical protein
MFAPPICRRSWRNNAFPFASSDEDGGNPANIAASGASNEIQRDARATQISEKDRSAAAVAPKPVTQSTYGLQRPNAERAVDLFSEIADVDLDHVGSVLVPDVPGRIQELTVTEYLSGTSHERLKQRELAGG